VRDIDSEQAKIPNELSQVAIRSKLSDLNNLQPIFWEKSMPFRIDGINVDKGLARQDTGEIDRVLVDQNQVDFRMRHSAGFDDIFDRGPLAQLPLHRRSLRSQKERQIAVKLELNHE